MTPFGVNRRRADGTRDRADLLGQHRRAPAPAVSRFGVPPGSLAVMDRAGSSSDAAPSSRGGFRAGHVAIVLEDQGPELLCVGGNVRQAVGLQVLTREQLAGGASSLEPFAGVTSPP